MTPNMQAFLDMIAISELGEKIIAGSDNGYNVLVGSLPDMIFTFSSYHRHPGILVDMDGESGGLESTAAGRYQILGRFWRAYKDQLGLKGFFPDDQDTIAIQMIKECRAVADIDGGFLSVAIKKCSSRWASLPGAGYGQHENTYQRLAAAFQKAGGVIA